MTVSKLFYSREDRLTEIGDDDRRFQNEPVDDADRLDAAMDGFMNTAYEFEKVADEYADSLAYGDKEHKKITRAKFVEAWAALQVAVSAVAWTARFDGNEAFNRMVEFAKNDVTYNMADL